MKIKYREIEKIAKIIELLYNETKLNASTKLSVIKTRKSIQEEYGIIKALREQIIDKWVQKNEKNERMKKTVGGVEYWDFKDEKAFLKDLNSALDKTFIFPQLFITPIEAAGCMLTAQQIEYLQELNIIQDGGVSHGKN